VGLDYGASALPCPQAQAQLRVHRWQHTPYWAPSPPARQPAARTVTPVHPSPLCACPPQPTPRPAPRSPGSTVSTTTNASTRPQPLHPRASYRGRLWPSHPLLQGLEGPQHRGHREALGAHGEVRAQTSGRAAACHTLGPGLPGLGSREQCCLPNQHPLMLTMTLRRSALWQRHQTGAGRAGAQGSRCSGRGPGWPVARP